VPPSQAPGHPDLGRLAAFVGAWQGEGEGEWEGRRFAYGERITFWQAGRPFLGYEQRTAASGDGRPLHSEAGYWRAVPDGRVELVLAHSTGHVELEVGRWEGERLELSTVFLESSPTAKPVSRLERSISVEGDQMAYELRMAAPDGPPRVHLRARLRRLIGAAGGGPAAEVRVAPGGDVPAQQPPLRPEDLGDDPIAALRDWYAAATSAGSPAADAMALATVGADGRPSVRMVLLRGLDQAGLAFHTNRESRKGRELGERPQASALLHWERPVHRQVRVEGRVELLPDADSDAYFGGRPPGAQISAWASPQSAVVSGREELDSRWAAARARFPEGAPIPRPPFWGGYRVVPEVVEFWQGRQDRFHDRIRFRQEAGRWRRERLAP
jgi:pyridoxamine 5'-phosphate oxidase